MEHVTPDIHHLMGVISNILLFFGIAGVVVPLLQRLKISPMLGYLICGIAIGPFGLAQFSHNGDLLSHLTIREPGTVQALGELGIITLMFMIGLELSFDRLKELRHYIFGLGSAQIVFTGVAIFIIASLFDNSPQAAILLGASFALSSTAIVMKMLEESRLASYPVGILCFSILLMQDLAVVPILVLASSFAGNNEAGVLVTMGTSLAVAVATVATIYLLGKRVLTPLLQSVSFSKSPEWLAAFIVFVVIACAALTHAAGLSLALGAFLAGLLIAETEFKHEVEVIIAPLKGLLLGMFFLSVGMMVDLAEVWRHPVLLLLSVIGIYVLKAAILLPVCLALRIPGRQAAEVSVYLAQPGEFALMILGVAMATGLMPASDIQFFLLVTVLAMIFSPLLFKLAPIAGDHGQRLFGKKRELTPTTDLMSGHRGVLIAGFGRVGQLLASVLEDEHIPYIAFDCDGERVQKLKQKGFRIIYGDARKKALWQRLINKQIELAVITIDDQEATRSILQALRAEFPLLPVIVRARDVQESNALYDKGANHVVAETLESSLRIAQLLMEQLGSKPEEAKQIIQKRRIQELQAAWAEQHSQVN